MFLQCCNLYLYLATRINIGTSPSQFASCAIFCLMISTWSVISNWWQTVPLSRIQFRIVLLPTDCVASQYRDIYCQLGQIRYKFAIARGGERRILSYAQLSLRYSNINVTARVDDKGRKLGSRPYRRAPQSSNDASSSQVGTSSYWVMRRCSEFWRGLKHLFVKSM